MTGGARTTGHHMNSRGSPVLVMLLILTGGVAVAGGPIPITVNLDGRSCVVHRRLTSCMTLPDMLLREVGASHRSPLSVTAEGCGRDAMARARAVADNLKAAGFSRVSIAGSMMEPNTGCVPANPAGR